MIDRNNPQLGFIYRFIYPTNCDDLKGTRDGQKAREKISSTTFLLLLGTGGNEEDLISLAYELDQSAAISPRGKALENGVAPRFFRRLTEGVFDVEDLKFRTNELANFVKNVSNTYGFDID